MSSRFSPDVERWLAPQERFERLRREALRRKGDRLCDLSYANPYGGPHPAAIQALREALETTRALDLQYTPYGGSTITRRVIATKLSTRHGLRLLWRHVVLTPGAMAALNILFRALRRDAAPSGDQVIVLTPCWMDYPLYLAQLGMEPVMVPLDGRLHLDLDRIEAALTPATRAIVLSQPSNPTGVVYTREELDGLAALLRAQPEPPLLISDECHRDVAAIGPQMPSPMELYERTAVVYSFGKSFFMQGQRVGYVAVSPRMADAGAFAIDLERVTRMMGFCTPTALMQLVVRRLVDVTPRFDEVVERRRRMAGALRQAGLEVTEPAATFFLYPRSPDPDDFRFVEHLADRGVLAMPASLFHHGGHFRLSLTASGAMFERALDVLGGISARVAS